MLQNNDHRGLNITTEEVTIRLEKGLYRFILGNIQTDDVNDSFSLTGQGEWLLSDTTGTFFVPKPDSENIYTCEQLQDGFTITIQVISLAVSFTLKTIDRYNYGDRNAPTNPTITLEIEEGNISSTENINRGKNDSALVGA